MSSLRVAGGLLCVALLGGEAAAQPPALPAPTCAATITPVAGQTTILRVPPAVECPFTLAGGEPDPKDDRYPRPLYVIRLESTHTDVAFWATLEPDKQPAWATDQGPPVGISSVESDAAGGVQTLVFWSPPSGTLTIQREDQHKGSADIVLTLERATMARGLEPRLQDGHSQRVILRNDDYDLLTAYGRCVRGDPQDDRCLELIADRSDAARRKAAGLPGRDPSREPVVPFAWQKDFKYSSVKDMVTAQVYYLASRWIGRDPVFEFSPLTPEVYANAVKSEAQGPGTSPSNPTPGAKQGSGSATAATVEIGKPDRGSVSEPLVLFIGVNGVNRVVLLDCHHVRDVPSTTAVTHDLQRCFDFAGPQARALERAEAFWAVSIEDEEAPFDTTIEVDFASARRDPSYEEFDPRMAATTAHAPAAVAALRRNVRFTWRRFRLRETPGNVEVAFTRQGPGYGLRQWRRVLVQRSKLAAVPAAAVFVPAYPVSRMETVLSPARVEGSLSGFETTEEETRRLIFGLLVIQWPQLRGKADDASPGHRFLVGLVPDVAVGFADHRLYFTGGSWPLALWRDRIFLTGGAVWAWERHFKPDLPPGTPFPGDVGRDLEKDNRWSFRGIRVGVSIEVLKLRK